jgi:hypothetical protein
MEQGGASPLDPMIALTHTIPAMAQYFAGNCADSMCSSQQALPSSSPNGPAYRTLIAGRVALGYTDEAREAARVYRLEL